AQGVGLVERFGAAVGQRIQERFDTRCRRTVSRVPSTDLRIRARERNLGGKQRANSMQIVRSYLDDQGAVAALGSICRGRGLPADAVPWLTVIGADMSGPAMALGCIMSIAFGNCLLAL